MKSVVGTQISLLYPVMETKIWSQINERCFILKEGKKGTKTYALP